MMRRKNNHNEKKISSNTKEKKIKKNPTNDVQYLQVSF